MSLSEGFSEDDLINITFEVCDAQQKGAVPATVFIKYLEAVTGQSHDHSKVLLLYDLLDPKRLNVPVTRETFHATMKKWIAICNQDCISETEADKGRTETIGNQQHKADEDAEIFEGGPEGFQIYVSSIEDLKYMNQKMTEQLLGVKKMMVSEETYVQLADDIVELRDRLISMQKPLRKFKYICTELDEIKNKMTHLHEDNQLICEFIRSLNKSITSLTTKLISLEENVKAHEERCTSGSEALFLSMWECFQNLFQKLKSQQESIFQMHVEEMKLFPTRVKLKSFIQDFYQGLELKKVDKMLANLCPYIKAWNKVLLKLEIFLESSQHLAKSYCLNIEHGEKQQIDEIQEYMVQSSLEEEMQPSSNYMGQACLRHEDTHKKKADDIYPVQKEGILTMKSKISSKISVPATP